MRCRLPRQHTGLFRTLGAAYRIAGKMRSQPGRQQCREHLARRQTLWPRMQRIKHTRRTTEEARVTLDTVLAIQPFRRARRVRRPLFLSQRSGHRAAQGFRGRIQQGLQRNRAAVRARRRFQYRRRAAQPASPTGDIAGRVVDRADRGVRLRSHANAADAYRSRVPQRFRGRRSGTSRGLGRAGGSLAGRRRPGLRPVVAQAPIPEAARGPDFGDRLRPGPVAAAAFAGGVLRTPAGGRFDRSGVVHRQDREESYGSVSRARYRHGDERGAAGRDAGL